MVSIAAKTILFRNFIVNMASMFLNIAKNVSFCTFKYYTP